MFFAFWPSCSPNYLVVIDSSEWWC